MEADPVILSMSSTTKTESLSIKSVCDKPAAHVDDVVEEEGAVDAMAAEQESSNKARRSRGARDQPTSAAGRQWFMVIPKAMNV